MSVLVSTVPDMVDDSTREGFRSFRVDVRGQAHWTVVGGGYEPHPAADAYLTHLRLLPARRGARCGRMPGTLSCS